MPPKHRHVCLEPGCPNLAERRGRCVDHARAYERTIGRAERGKYGSRRWRILRARYLSDHGVCEGCRRRVSEHVHHRVDIAVDPTRMYDPTNLEALCASCHSRETRRRQLHVVGEGCGDVASTS